MLMLDRKNARSPNGLVFGTPGGGKSFSCKREMIGVLLKTHDHVLVCDPEGEYAPLVKLLHGQIIKLSPTSRDYLNPLDINLNYSEDENPLALKSDFVLSLCELIMGGKTGLEAIERTVIDRAVQRIYQPYFADPRPENMPILSDLHAALTAQHLPEADRVAQALDLYVSGSLNFFNNRTTVDIDNRFVCFDIKELPKNLKKPGMLVIQDQVWNRVTRNRNTGVSTWYYADELYRIMSTKESDVDYVFNNVGFSSASGLYSLHLSDAARGRAELELAKKLIDDYCREEFHSGADFSDLSAVGIGHTTITDDEIPIQAYANLTDFRVEKYLGDVLIESRQYESLAALIQGELNDLEFGDLTYASDEQIAMFHAQEEVPGKEATSLNPAVQPVVTILWSESDKLQEGEQLPLARADALFKALDDEKRSEREKPGYTGGWYDKTKFRIDCTFHGERDSYEGRQDFGDGDGALIDHIQAYHEYYAKDESWKNFVLHNEGTEAWEKDKAERETLLTEFVPYMRLHCNLSEQERTAADMLENGEALTPEQTAYFHAVLAHVDACREKLNAGDYHLPDPPQLSDFDKELQDYKAHVESEIAQEAEAAGMTVEEYAANGYEPQEQPTDVQEQPEETPSADTVPEQTAVRYYTINEGAARRANDANSYRDYAAGSATAEYRQMVDQAAAIAQRQKERIDPSLTKTHTTPQGTFPVFSLSPGKSPLTCSAAPSSRNPLPLTPT